MLSARGIVILAIAAVAAYFMGAPSAPNNPLNPPLPLYWLGLPFRHATIVYAVVVAVLIAFGCFVWSRRLSKENPGRGQALLEMVIRTFDSLCAGSFGTLRRGRLFLGIIITLFLFFWVCNMIGTLPTGSFSIGGESYQDLNFNSRFDPGEPFVDSNGNGAHDPGLFIPSSREPTSDVSMTLGIALLLVFLLGHGSQTYYQGIGGYIKEYFSPGGMIGLVMSPLNAVGRVAEIISISFRLFGNIFGGAVIISVVSGLAGYLILPPLLYGFFGVFVGTVQAFVFTMLTLTYVSAGAAEEVEQDDKTPTGAE